MRSMESLRGMEKMTARVRRKGPLAEIPASQLVAGDIVVIEDGDMVSGDRDKSQALQRIPEARTEEKGWRLRLIQQMHRSQIRQ